MQDRTTSAGSDKLTNAIAYTTIVNLELKLQAAEGILKMKLRRLDEFKAENEGCDATAIEAVYDTEKANLIKHEADGIAMPELWNTVHRLFSLMMEANDIEQQICNARIHVKSAQDELYDFIIKAFNPDNYTSDSRTYSSRPE